MRDDLVQELRDWANLIDEIQGKAILSMLSGEVHRAAADRIEALEKEIAQLRNERVAQLDNSSTAMAAIEEIVLSLKDEADSKKS